MSILEFIVISLSKTSETISTKDIVGWIVVLISAVIATGWLIYTAKSYRQNSDAKFIEIFKDIDKEISELENNRDRLDPKKE